MYKTINSIVIDFNEDGKKSSIMLTMNQAKRLGSILTSMFENELVKKDYNNWILYNASGDKFESADGFIKYFFI